MQLAKLLVVHVPGPLRQPVIGTRHNGEHGARDQHVVEVSNNEVSVVVLHIGWCDREHQARETTDCEQKDKCERKQHRRFERH